MAMRTPLRKHIGALREPSFSLGFPRFSRIRSCGEPGSAKRTRAPAGPDRICYEAGFANSVGVTKVWRIFGKPSPGPGRLHVARFGNLLEYIGFINVSQHFVRRPAALPYGLLFAMKCLSNLSSRHASRICLCGEVQSVESSWRASRAASSP